MIELLFPYEIAYFYYGVVAQTLKLSEIGTSPVAADLVLGGAASIQDGDRGEKSSSVLGASARAYGQ
ncbi:hypothetical protein [Pelistega suis]|uniref:Uncharacterized protein n=1 Tax=Pelistega suis TaxID=1631957 RepID=A0A849P1P7_9BURK|nr:hypothetical protein [Pelistega suis]NOL51340.1 hypothetical protein [Pelistega suis]